MTERQPLSPALREAAALLDAHDLPEQPYITSSVDGSVSLAWYLYIGFGTNDHGLAAQRDTAAEIVRALGGHWDKGQDDVYASYSQRRGLLRLNVQVSRPAVCERVVTGTRTITSTIPDPDALAQVPTVEVTQEVEDVEWVCRPLLADRDESAQVSA